MRTRPIKCPMESCPHCRAASTGPARFCTVCGHEPPRRNVALRSVLGILAFVAIIGLVALAEHPSQPPAAAQAASVPADPPLWEQPARPWDGPIVPQPIPPPRVRHYHPVHPASAYRNEHTGVYGQINRTPAVSDAEAKRGYDDSMCVYDTGRPGAWEKGLDYVMLPPGTRLEILSKKQSDGEVAVRTTGGSMCWVPHSDIAPVQ